MAHALSAGMMNRTLFQNVASRNRLGMVRDLAAGVMLAIGLASGASALALSSLPPAQTMDAVLKANPPTSADLAAWACAAGDEVSCEQA